MTTQNPALAVTDPVDGGRVQSDGPLSDVVKREGDEPSNNVLSGSAQPRPQYLLAECGVRYWEDATVNGEVDEDGSRIPCREGDAWRPLICLATGIIVDWPPGVTADIHYKVCDDGRYTLLDAHRKPICAIDGYVPGMMGPGGYGDYVIMQVGPDGQIQNWRGNLEPFRDALAKSAAGQSPTSTPQDGSSPPLNTKEEGR